MNASSSQPLPAPHEGKADTVPRPVHPGQAQRAMPRGGVGRGSRASTRGPVKYPLVSQMTPLGALKTAAGAARAHLRNTLAEWNMAAHQEVAELLASELVTNAVLASADGQGNPVYVDGQLPVVIFRLIAHPEVLVLEVWDQVPSPPVMREVDVWGESGRGLFLVHTLAARWSWKTVPDWPGKCVWAELREPPQPLGGDS